MPAQRMLYVDNLRLCAIVLVVALHSAITYSGLGGWYYKEGLPIGRASLWGFAIAQCFLQAFFMGTLFMLAGYYAAAALKSKGTGAFLKGRLARLGVPTLVYMLAIGPLTHHMAANRGKSMTAAAVLDEYTRYVASFKFLGGSGPMWFALALLIFCAVYALAGALAGGVNPERHPRPFPSRLPVLLSLAASAGAFLLRLEWPMGTNVLNMQLCYFSQYVILFCLGIAAHGADWFDAIPYDLGRRLLAAAFLGVPVLAAIFASSGALEGDVRLWGGMNWVSAVFSVWESFTGVFMSVGLVAVLRERWNTQTPLVSDMSASGFAVYVFHPPVVVGVTLLLTPVALPAFPKFLLAFSLALPASFFLAKLVRATPLLREMVKS